MNRIAGFTLVFSLVFPGLRLTSPGWLRAAVLTPMFLVLIQGGNCEAQAEVDSNSVVCVSSSGSVTTKALVGATLEDHIRLYTNRYAFDNFENCPILRVVSVCLSNFSKLSNAYRLVYKRI